MPQDTLAATAVIRKNSLGFVETLFDLNQAGRPLVVVSNAAQAATLPGLAVEDCVTPDDRSGWITRTQSLSHAEQVAQVTYTSGTEGLPKGIVLTHANLADAAERIIAEMQMTSDIREYVGVPATYSFGMGRYRAIAAVGGQAYLPPRGFDPMELARMLKAGEVNALSAVPSLLRILLDAPEVIGAAGQNLRWLEIGSQHMLPEEKRRIREIFPKAIIVQHYGLTEASRSTFLRIDGAETSALASVGRPVGQTEIGLSAEGRIRIRGPHVARHRIDGEGLHDLLDAEGWLQTNDLGHWQGAMLVFDGRADDLINCGGVKLAPDQLEERLRADLPARLQLAVAKVPDAQRGDGILVALSGAGAEDHLVPMRKAAERALAEFGIQAGSALHLRALAALPVTETGKVQRKELTQGFTADPVAPPPTAKAEVKDVFALFRHEFPGESIRAEDTFETLGGDSLHFIRFSLSFEKRFGQLPDGWEQMTVAALQTHVSGAKKSIWRRLETATLTRAFFMVCIVALHTEAFVYSPNWGAAYFLIMLAGYSMARFQLPEILRTGSVKTLVGTIKYVAIPTVIVVAILQVLTQRFEILPLLLVSNYLDPFSLKGYAFYFMEFYIQILVLAALIFAVPQVQRAFASRPVTSAVALLVCVSLLYWGIEAIWDGEYNFHRTPWNYGWAFALGVLFAVAQTRPTQALALAAVTLACLLKWKLSSATFYLVSASALVIYVRALTVPTPVKIAMGEIANASMFIYLCHFQVISVLNKVSGGQMPWTALILSILMGVGGAHAYAWAERRLHGLQVFGRSAKAL